MLKRHAVQVLRKAGHTLEETAKLGGVSVRSVQRIEDEPAVVQLEGEEERRRNVGRPSKAEPFRGFVTDLLREEPELLSVEVLRRARLKGYEGGKSALYELVASCVRSSPASGALRGAAGGVLAARLRPGRCRFDGRGSGCTSSPRG